MLNITNHSPLCIRTVVDKDIVDIVDNYVVDIVDMQISLKFEIGGLNVFSHFTIIPFCEILETLG